MTSWELGDDGRHLAVPIRPVDADEVRAWCSASCKGDFMIVLGRSVVFALREDAALAALWWCRGDE